MSSHDHVFEIFLTITYDLVTATGVGLAGMYLVVPDTRQTTSAWPLTHGASACRLPEGKIGTNYANANAAGICVCVFLHEQRPLWPCGSCLAVTLLEDVARKALA